MRLRRVLFLLVLTALSASADETIPFVRTPDERFVDLPGYSFKPNYLTLSNGLRMHYLDEGKGEIILCLHGEPTWSYLYRKMIPILSEHYRVIAPDLLGFGKSDKPTRAEDFDYAFNFNALVEFLEKLDLKNVTLVCQDWGGLLGLPLATENQHRFARMVIMNTGLATGKIDFQSTQDAKIPIQRRQALVAFLAWKNFAAKQTNMDVGKVIEMGTTTELSPAVRAAYDAPFPDARYKVGAHKFPAIVPMNADDYGAKKMAAAKEALRNWTKPALVMFSDLDPIMAGGDVEFRALIPSAKEEPTIVIKDASHFLQEDKGEEIARHIVDFLKRRPLP